MATFLFHPIAWFLFFVLAHIVIFHVNKKISRAKVIIRCFLLSAIGLMSSITYNIFFQVYEATQPTLPEITLIYIYSLAIIFSLFILYMPFFYTISSSLSAQSLINIAEARNSALPRSITSLRVNFTSEEFITNRFILMQHNGYLIKSENFYSLSRKGELIGNIFSRFKNLWRLGAGG